MARRLKWSKQAQLQRKSIFEYWNHHNQSKAFSKKLNNLFKEALNKLKEHPYSGRQTSIDNVFIIRVRTFFLSYYILHDSIVVISLWDGRRNIPLP